MQAHRPLTKIERMEEEDEGGGSQFYRFEPFARGYKLADGNGMREGANQRLESSKVRGDWQGKRTFSGEIVENWRVALSLSLCGCGR